MQKIRIGSHIIELKQTTSTNTDADILLHSARPQDGTVIIAYHQSQGRGQEQNKWESEPGKNLTFSIILYPEFLDPSRQFLLSQAVALGIVDFLAKLIPANRRLSIKWPNDIYVDEQKICGTLVQNGVTGDRLSESIVGIGLNINQEQFLSDAPNPISLKQIIHRDQDLRTCLILLCESLDERYNQLRSAKTEQIETTYHSLLYRLEEWHDFQIHDQWMKAKIKGIGDFGQLQLEDGNGQIHTCGMKEVVYGK